MGIDDAVAAGWELAVSKCGGCRAALRGTEIHVEFTRPGVINRGRVREFLGPLLERQGYLTTRVPGGDSRARFVTRLGFRPTWSDDEFSYYMLTELPFSRSKES